MIPKIVEIILIILAFANTIHLYEVALKPVSETQQLELESSLFRNWIIIGTLLAISVVLLVW